MTTLSQIQPFDQSETPTNVPLSNLNYANQDFESLKRRLVQFTNERFPDDFKDFIESDLGIMLIENWAFIGDMLSFKMDQQVNELFIDTVTELENAFRLSDLVGFDPTPPIPAKAQFTASISSVLPSDLIITTPVTTTVSVAGETLTFELFPADENGNPIFDEDIRILQGNLSTSAVVGVEGNTVNESFVGNAAPNQSLALARSPVLFDSVRVQVDGVEWTEVSFFTDSQPRQEFRVEYNSEFEAFVMFGNNSSGQIPSNGSNIFVSYRVGGGARGNIITGAINTQLNINLEGFDSVVPTAFTNFTQATGGFDGDNIEDIRSKLPAFLSSQDRMVSGKDIKTITDQFATANNGKIGKSTAVLRNYGCAGNIVDLYVLALKDENDLEEASDTLKLELNEFIDDKKMFTDFICIRDGVVLEVDISIDVLLDKIFRKNKEEINTKILDRINQFFLLSKWDYDRNLKDTELIKELADVAELKTIEITFTTTDPENSGTLVTTDFFEIIRPDEVEISFVFE